MNDEWTLWVKREATTLPAFTVTDSLKTTDKALEIPVTFSRYRFVEYTWWQDAKERKAIDDALLHKIEQDIEYVFRITAKQYKLGEDLKKFVRDLPEECSRTELVELIGGYEEKLAALCAMWVFPIPVGEILENKVRLMLAKRNIDTTLEQLIFVSRDLELTRERKELMVFGKSIAADSFEELSKEESKLLNEHAQTFGWLSTTYHLGKALTARDYFDRIHIEESEDVLQEIMQQEDTQKKLMESLKSILSGEEYRLVQAMQEVIFFRNYQKETVNEAVHRSELLLSQVATELDLTLKEVTAFSLSEILELLKNEASPERDEIQKRLQSFAIIMEDGRSFITSDVEEYRIADDENNNLGEVQGNVGFPGVVTGYARVIHKKSDLDDFDDGEVLVAVMTSIDFVPFMKKALAIVTDEGGITCHAAIVARELKKPCVIGTKDATSIFRTGDTLEVDAEQGIVRKI